jgi:translation initiation factor IF-1
MRALLTGEFQGQEERAVGGGGIYIGLSQESSRWAKIQNRDKVWGEPDNVRLGLSVKIGGSLG